MLRTKLFPLFILLLMLGITGAVYTPGLQGDFVFDDVVNIRHNPNIAIKEVNAQNLARAASSSDSSALGRPLSMLTFAANYYTTGYSPFFYKLTNLLLHLLNGVGLFLLTNLLLGFYRGKFRHDLSVNSLIWTSVALASVWLLHPLNLTTVLYVVQRMAGLSAFFCIYGLVVFLWGRIRLYEGKHGALLILISLLLFTPLAILSKENGVLLPVFMLIIEITLFNFQTSHLAARRFLVGFYSLFIAIPLVLGIAYIALHPEWITEGYANREFTLKERVLTESRVLWFYLRQILLPDVSQMGLYLDDFSISRSMMRPVSTLISLVSILALLAGAMIYRKKFPLITFGVFFFFSGHLLESTIYVLDIAYEHRNYLPMYGILLPPFFYLLASSSQTNHKSLRSFVVILFIALLGFGTSLRATSWRSPLELFQSEYRHHPNSVRNNIELGYLYGNIIATSPLEADKNFNLASQHFEMAAALNENDVGGLLGLITVSAEKGKPINPEWVKELSLRLEKKPIAANTSDKILLLTRCSLTRRCKLPERDVQSVLNAVLRNPTLSGTSRSKVLFAQSIYLINVNHDYFGALDAMQHMVSNSPNELPLRIELIKFLIALEHTDKAQLEIRRAREIDYSNAYFEELEHLELEIFSSKIISD